jgi:hypothetical protein
MSVEASQKPNIAKPRTILENQDLSFLNNPSNQQKELVGNNNLNEDVINPNNPKRQSFENIVQEPDNQNTLTTEQLAMENVQRLNNISNNNEVIAQINAQNEALFRQNELLKQQVNQLQQQVAQLSQPKTQQQIAQQTGQQATPEQLQQVQAKAEQVTKKEGIKGLLKWVKENPLKAAGAALLIAGGGYIAMSAAVALSASLTATTGVMGASGAFGTFGSVMPGFLATGTSTLAAQMFAGTVAVGGTLAMAKGVSMLHNGANEKIQPAQPTPETTPQQQPVAEQQVQQPQFRENIEGNMEQAKNIVRGLEEIKGEKISFMYGESVVELYSKNGKYLYDTTNQGGTVTGETDEKTLTQTLSGYPENVLVSLQQQINDKKAEQSKPVEQLNSPENQERAPESINLDELEAGDSVTLTFDQNGNEQTIKLVKNQDGTVNKFNTYGTKTGENLEVASKTTIENGNVQTITTDPNVISTAPNTVVVISGDYPNGISVKSVTVEKLAAAKPETTAPSTPEATKSPEAISQSAYTKIGENLDKINEAAKKPSVDILKGAWGGYFEGANATALDDQLNKPEFLDKLDGYLDNKPVTEGFSTEPEFDNITLLRTCLAIANLDIPKEVKDSLKSNNLPQAITEFKGNNLVGDLLNFAGPNLEAAKQVLRANKEIEKAKKESEKYDNDNVKAGVVGVELLKSSNQIITSQIPEFKDSNTVWDKNKVIDAIEGDLKTGSTTLSEGKHPVAEQIIELGNSYLKTPEESVAA